MPYRRAPDRKIDERVYRFIKAAAEEGAAGDEEATAVCWEGIRQSVSQRFTTGIEVRMFSFLGVKVKKRSGMSWRGAGL